MEADRVHRFSGTVFRNVMARLEETMSGDTIRAVFRLVGRDLGEGAAERIRAGHNVSNCDLKEFARTFADEVIAPATGASGVAIETSPADAKIEIHVCPFEKMGFDISNKFYCTYTEGLIGRVFEEKLGKEAQVEMVCSRGSGSEKCSFEISE